MRKSFGTPEGRVLEVQRNARDRNESVPSARA
jgi:hypothetical protein